MSRDGHINFKNPIDYRCIVYCIDFACFLGQLPASCPSAISTPGKAAWEKFCHSFTSSTVSATLSPRFRSQSLGITTGWEERSDRNKTCLNKDRIRRVSQSAGQIEYSGQIRPPLLSNRPRFRCRSASGRIPPESAGEIETGCRGGLSGTDRPMTPDLVGELFRNRCAK